MNQEIIILATRISDILREEEKDSLTTVLIDAKSIKTTSVENYIPTENVVEWTEKAKNHLKK